MIMITSWSIIKPSLGKHCYNYLIKFVISLVEYHHHNLHNKLFRPGPVLFFFFSLHIVFAGKSWEFVWIFAPRAEERIWVPSSWHDPNRIVFVRTTRNFCFRFRNHSRVAPGKTRLVKIHTNLFYVMASCGLYSIQIHGVAMHALSNPLSCYHAMFNPTMYIL